jgi:hypothetical protein
MLQALRILVIGFTLLKLGSYFLLVVLILLAQLTYLCLKLSVHVILHLLHVECHVLLGCLVKLVKFLYYFRVILEFLRDLGC